MRRRVLALLAAGVIALAASPASARVPEKTRKRHLEASIRRTMTLPPVRPATPGILVLRGGRPAIEINADRPFRPASVLKLATTTTALTKFGPDHRFVTRVVGRAPAGGVTGSVTLIGGGDPTLATRAYVAEHFIPKPDDPIPVPVFASGSPTIQSLASAIDRAGVRTIGGNLYVDDSLFDSRRTQPGWIPDYQRNDPDVGNIGALTVNEGYADVDGNVVAPDPAANAGNALLAALESRGITVTGSVRRARAPAGAKELARVSSPPLREIIDYTNRYSANYAAEMLLKGLGARFGGAGTTVAGVRVVNETLAGLGVPLRGFAMYDGSGLSVSNRMTPRTAAGILDWILRSDAANAQILRTTLPVAGGPGTLFRRMTRAPTKGNLRAKTGSIRRVRTLAGWVTPPDGVPLVFVTMFNNVPRPALLTAPMDLIGRTLALFGRA